MSSFPVLSEALADREGLSGTARTRFLRLLKEHFRYVPTRPIPWLCWLWAAVGAGMVGAAVSSWQMDGRMPGWWLAVWGLSSLAGVLLALALRLSDRQQADRDLELQWRIYCGMVRPIIVAKEPGLLDRNRIDETKVRLPMPTRPWVIAWALLHDERGGSWRASMWGLWAGMAGLLGLAPDDPPVSWLLGLPAAGIALGLLAWISFRAVALYVVRRDSQLGL